MNKKRNPWTTYEMDLLRNGTYTIKEMAEYRGTSKQAVQQFMKKNGIENVSRRRHLNESEKTEIKKLLRQGITCTALSSRYGCNINTIARYKDPATKKKVNRSRDLELCDILDILQKRKEGNSYKAIANLTGFSITTVQRYVVGRVNR
ncbi:MAG: hypothetical protein ACRCZH_03305 [Cetobacterium sp.]